jgi:hypothetical protein
MTDANLLFDLTPDKEQQMTREVVRRFAKEEMAEKARDSDEAATLPTGFLQQTVDLGLSFMPIPEDMGGVGAGRSVISNVLNIEDLASGDMSMAIAALTPLSVINCLLDAGSKVQQADVFNRLATENFTPAAIALMETGIGFNAHQLNTIATEQEDGSFILIGEKAMVAYGDNAEVIIAFAMLKDEVAAFIINKDTSGISFAREDYMGLRPLPLYNMVLDSVKVAPESKLAGELDIQQLINNSKVATSALAVGTCQAVLDYVVPYVNQREAFGEPISNRQAVAFMVADMATEIETMRLMTYRAASQADQGIDNTKSASLALRNSIKHSMKIGTDGVQLLGGHGFTREHPCEMWYRNLRAIATLDGMLIA